MPCVKRSVKLYSLTHSDAQCMMVICCCECRTCYVPRDSERKARREIANSNERRRMQSINAGFQALRKMLQPRDGDKLSKVFHAVYFICSQPTPTIPTMLRDELSCRIHSIVFSECLTVLEHAIAKGHSVCLSVCLSH